MCRICGLCLGVGSFRRSEMITVEDTAECYNTVLDVQISDVLICWERNVF